MLLFSPLLQLLAVLQGVDGIFVEFPDQAAMVIERVLSKDSTVLPTIGTKSAPPSPLLSNFESGSTQARKNCVVNRRMRGCDIDITLWNPSYTPRWLRGKSLTAMS